MSWIEDPGVAEFRGLNLTQLGVDEAYVNVTSQIPGLWLYTLSQECYKCPYSRHLALDEVKEPFKWSTQYRHKWRIMTDGSAPTVPAENYSGVACEMDADLGEFGVYDLRIHDGGGGGSSKTICELDTALEPVNIYFPLLLCVLGLLVLWVICSGIAAAVRRWGNHKHTTISPIGHEMRSPEDKAAGQPAAKKRVKSLDTFRGISIVLMIFVNYGAGSYAVLQHATWNGLHVADLVFPWFMWIMGVCIPISVTSQLKKNVSRCKMFFSVLRRACILFLLGVMLNTINGSRLETIRIFGVLQRFGVVYFVVATLAIMFTCRNCATPKMKVVAAVQDILILLPQWVIMLGVVAGHCAITFLMSIPGCPMGYMGPGGNHDNGIYKDCIGGATGYIDKMILGPEHIYQHPTAAKVYNAGPFDPEGIVGCLLSIFQVFLGVQAGTILVLHRNWKGRISRWMVWGSMCGIVGGVLCLASKEGGWIPVNKNLWSLSFVLVTSCFAFYLLSFCYFLIDVKHWWSGAPFYYPGMNATIMYVGHEMTSSVFPWHWAFGVMNTHFILLLENLWGTALWVIIAIWLHHVKFFLSI
ncbi:heparan-alpha-glucosaminide N-acetyltransferase isoform X2 [Anabrus simplex]